MHYMFQYHLPRNTDLRLHYSFLYDGISVVIECVATNNTVSIVNTPFLSDITLLLVAKHTSLDSVTIWLQIWLYYFTQSFIIALDNS